MLNQYEGKSDIYHQYEIDLKKKREGKKDVIEILELNEKPSISVLEYGCGTGVEAHDLLLHHPNISQYLAIDNSQSNINAFREHVNDPKATALLADMDSYIPTPGTYDLVFGMLAVHYTRDIGSLMKRVNLALKPGGFFVFRDAHPLVGFLRKKSKRYDVKEDVAFPLAGGSNMTVTHPTFTMSEYINAAADANFRILKADEKMGNMSAELGIDGYEIPTTVVFYLKKD